MTTQDDMIEADTDVDAGEWRDETWVYAGRNLDDNNKVVHRWMEPDGTMSIVSKRYVHVAIGGHAIFHTNDRKFQTSGPHAPHAIATRHGNAEQVAQWVAHDASIDVTIRHKAIERKANRVNPLADTLANIAAVAAVLSGPEKRAYAALLLEALYIPTKYVKGGSE